LKKALDGWGSDETGTTGSRDKLEKLAVINYQGLKVLTRTETEPHLPLSFVGRE
jgi:hypothetical protein